VSVSPSKACIRVPRQTDSIWEFVLTDARGEPVDITGDHVEFLVMDKPDGVIKLSLVNDETEHMDEENGRTSFGIDHHAFDAETGIDILFWVFEVWRIRASGQMALHLSGTFVLEPVLRSPHVDP
jgi:hypothetical protein